MSGVTLRDLVDMAVITIDYIMIIPTWKRATADLNMPSRMPLQTKDKDHEKIGITELNKLTRLSLSARDKDYKMHAHLLRKQCSSLRIRHIVLPWVELILPPKIQMPQYLAAQLALQAAVPPLAVSLVALDTQHLLEEHIDH